MDKHPVRAERERELQQLHTHYKQGKPAGREERKHASIAYGDVCVRVFGGERKKKRRAATTTTTTQKAASAATTVASLSGYRNRLRRGQGGKPQRRSRSLNPRALALVMSVLYTHARGQCCWQRDAEDVFCEFRIE